MSVESLLLAPAKLAAHAAALPIRACARTRAPAVADPRALVPGSKPPTDGRLLLLFDGGCGICLHARDVFAVLDRHHHLAFDRIARHDRGLLRDMTEERRYGSWHVVHPDGSSEDGALGIAAALEQLQGGKSPARAIRQFPDVADRGYRWFARNRGWISRGSGLINHPERDPREQPDHPQHEHVLSLVSP